MGSLVERGGKVVPRFVQQGLAAGSLEAGDMSMRKLRSMSSEPGLLDLILAKKSIKDFFVGRFVDMRNIHAG